MFRTLLNANLTAMSGEQYEVAYHALAAALHAAADARDCAQLAEVGDIAVTQLGWINRNAPGHRLSTGSAASRGNKSPFASLAAQSRSTRGRIRIEAALAASRLLPAP
jgi:hypothetical protein